MVGVLIFIFTCLHRCSSSQQVTIFFIKCVSMWLNESAMLSHLFYFILYVHDVYIKNFFPPTSDVSLWWTIKGLMVVCMFKVAAGWSSYQLSALTCCFCHVHLLWSVVCIMNDYVNVTIYYFFDECFISKMHTHTYLHVLAMIKRKLMNNFQVKE